MLKAHLKDDVSSLLIIQTSNESHQGNIWVHRQPQLFLQCQLAGTLAFLEIGAVVVLWNVLVSRRVPVPALQQEG